ncbi:MAG: D-glycerate 2-kinase [Steroidobacteraceae bacterium]|nr:D-glycerate 2-kinase [Steroidobacteraceae bacterium]
MSPSRRHPRALLLDWFVAALRAVDGRSCVRAALATAPIVADGAAVVLAVGKAASRMTLGACEALGPRIDRALVITKAGSVDAALRDRPRVTIIESAHPLPDARSLAAGAQLLDWVDTLAPHEWPLFLVSGGASSLVEVLREGVTLAELAARNRSLLAGGEAIEAVNARRRELSRIKGGALIGRLRGRGGLALFLSDVPGDDPAVIGSGLAGPAPEGVDRITRRVVANVEVAVEAVREEAVRSGLRVRVGAERFTGDAATLGARLAAELAARDTDVFVYGGESTVRLPEAAGRGGRNQHLALAAARALHGTRGLTLLAAGTDGTDGPTGDAGALVDGGTWQRILDAGLDAQACLARADSGAALEAAGDLLHTGATGTNVGDLVIGLAHMV